MSGTPPRTDRTSSSWPRLDAIRVLLVDDDLDARELFTEVLASQGAQVVTADAGQEALDAFRAFAPDVIVSDLRMPGMDGFELIRRIRSGGTARGATTPAVAVTVLVDPEDVVRAMEAGFQKHVRKPVDPPVLLETVLQLCRGSRARGSEVT